MLPLTELFRRRRHLQCKARIHYHTFFASLAVNIGSMQAVLPKTRDA